MEVREGRDRGRRIDGVGEGREQIGEVMGGRWEEEKQVKRSG